MTSTRQPLACYQQRSYLGRNSSVAAAEHASRKLPAAAAGTGHCQRLGGTIYDHQHGRGAFAAPKGVGRIRGGQAREVAGGVAVAQAGWCFLS